MSAISGSSPAIATLLLTQRGLGLVAVPLGSRHSQSPQTFASLRGFGRARETRDQAIQLANACFFLSELQQRIAFLELGRRGFLAAGKLLQHLVIILHSCVEVALAVLDVREIELGVAGEIGVAVVLQVVAEFLRRKVIFAGVIVAQRVVVEDVGWRSGVAVVGCAPRRAIHPERPPWSPGPARGSGRSAACHRAAW